MIKVPCDSSLEKYFYQVCNRCCQYKSEKSAVKIESDANI